MNPHIATVEAFQLAEGPVWDATRARLLWVDILGGAVLEGALDDLEIRVTRRHQFDEKVGAVAFADDGGLLVAGQERLHVIEADGTRRVGPRVVPDGEGRRMNDGGVDPAGRFLVGTMPLDGSSNHETLVRLEHDGTLTILDDDLTLSNGLTWTADGTRFYSIDTLTGNVFVRDYDPDTGSVGERSVHIHVEDGSPDGLTVDMDGHLWIAIHGIGEVRRFDPAGEVVDRIDLPAPHTTCPTLAGTDLRTLVITTAAGELDRSSLEEYPASGRLFTTRVDVPGLPATPWIRTDGFVEPR